MKTSDAIQLQGLLKIARANLQRGRAEMKKVAYPVEMRALGSVMNYSMLALEQTIDALDSVLEDFK